MMTLAVDIDQFLIFVFQQAQHFGTVVLVPEHGTHVLQWWSVPSRNRPSGFGVACEFILSSAPSDWVTYGGLIF